MTLAGDGASLRQSSFARWPGLALAGLAGALTVFGYAPFGWAGLPILTLALLFGLWHRAPRARDAAWLGFAFGVGLFGAGVSWLFIALQTFGGMPAPLAAVAIAGLVAFLSLYPALAGWIVVRWTAPNSLARLLAAASAFVLAEWLRGYLFTGFPWLAAGYSQLPDSPLVGFAPVGGVWLVSLAVTLVAALLVHAVDAIETGRWRVVLGCAIGAAAIAMTGAALRGIEWTTPSGEPLPVSLVQGNVAQDLKFDAAFREQTFALYQASGEDGSRTADRAPRVDVSDVRRRGSRRRRRRPREHRESARRRAAVRRVRRRSAGAGKRRTADLQQRRVRRHGAHRPVPQAPSGAVRRDHSREAAGRLGDAQPARDPDRRPGARSRRYRRPSASGTENHRRQHLLRGRVRRRASRSGARRDAARERDQRRLVRPLDRGAPAQSDRGDARDRARTPDAARYEHRASRPPSATTAACLRNCRGSRAACWKSRLPVVAAKPLICGSAMRFRSPRASVLLALAIARGRPR